MTGRHGSRFNCHGEGEPWKFLKPSIKWFYCRVRHPRLFILLRGLEGSIEREQPRRVGVYAVVGVHPLIADFLEILHGWSVLFSLEVSHDLGLE